MFKKSTIEVEIKRYQSDFSFGLTDEQVNERKKDNLVNKTPLVVGKSTWEILRSNVFTFFNILLIILGALMLYGNIMDKNSKWHTGLFFLLILLSNVVIGLYQDLKARHLMKKMKLITTQDTKVIRNGKELLIKPSEIVLDDILILKAGEQVPSDSYVVDGQIAVDESMLTGESIDINKKVGDLLLSGTTIRSGRCYARAERVGKHNFVETLSSKAKAFKHNPSHILKSLKRLFRSLGFVVIAFIAVIVTTYAALGYFSTTQGFINAIVPLSGQFVAMVPAGLYLLTSFTLATGVLTLSKRHANVQELYSIEMLARADVLCVDKTGTITDGTMVVNQIIEIGKYSKDEIEDIVINIIDATKDENQTAAALIKSFKSITKMVANTILPFDSANKYSGATFTSGVTYLLGAAEYLNLDNKEEILATIESLTSKGLRVLVLAKGNNKITSNKYDGLVEAIGIIALQDHIKEDAKTTFEWFKQNHVNIKVISGDNALTVSEIAKQAGIDHADSYISLDGLSIEEVKKIAGKYTVFGRVTPEQKEAIVMELKEQGHTVAMTGDGVNDMLALKRADCSIAMNSGAQAAKNVSHVVLMNNDFSTMPDIVSEGRRVINNLERTGSMFLVKTFFAITMSFSFWLASIVTKNKISYPFSPSNFMIWETFGVGMSAFFISLERNPKPITKGFLRNILLNAVPSAIFIVLAVFVVYFACYLQNHGIIYTGIDSFGFDPNNPRLLRSGATAICVIIFSIMSIMVLFDNCRPLNKYRGTIVFITIIGTIITLIVSSMLPTNLFGIDFKSITNPNILFIVVTLIPFLFVMYYTQEITQFVKNIIYRRVKNNED